MGGITEAGATTTVAALEAEGGSWRGPPALDVAAVNVMFAGSWGR